MLNYKEKYQDFYNSKEWRALRTWKFAEANGLCEDCRENGKIVVGKEVHHLVEISKDWSKRLDPDNLVLLCSDCHNKIHNRQSPLQAFNIFWEGI